MTASNLSLRQQWKGLQSTVADKWRDFGRFLASTPPGQVYLAIARFIDKLFEPLRQAWDVVVYVAITWYNNQAEWYNFFIREETKRKWTWSVEFRQELDFFSMCFEGGKIVMAVALYVMVVPAVFWIVVLPPLWVAWIWYPNAFWSPFALGLAIMLPLKFPPWLPIRWLW